MLSSADNKIFLYIYWDQFHKKILNPKTDLRDLKDAETNDCQYDLWL